MVKVPSTGDFSLFGAISGVVLDRGREGYGSLWQPRCGCARSAGGAILADDRDLSVIGPQQKSLWIDTRAAILILNLDGGGVGIEGGTVSRGCEGDGRGNAIGIKGQVTNLSLQFQVMEKVPIRPDMPDVGLAGNPY